MEMKSFFVEWWVNGFCIEQFWWNFYRVTLCLRLELMDVAQYGWDWMEISLMFEIFLGVVRNKKLAVIFYLSLPLCHKIFIPNIPYFFKNWTSFMNGPLKRVKSLLRHIVLKNYCFVRNVTKVKEVKKSFFALLNVLGSQQNFQNFLPITWQLYICSHLF